VIDVDQLALFCFPPRLPRSPRLVVAVRVAGSRLGNVVFRQVKLFPAYVHANCFEQILMQNDVGSQRRKCLLTWLLAWGLQTGARAREAGFPPAFVRYFLNHSFLLHDLRQYLSFEYGEQ
jgi:hypothetical protein